MKAIILAGGKATRLPRSAKNVPKALVRVSGKPILQHQIDWLESYGIKDIRLALGLEADKIVDYLGGKYEYMVEPEPLGTGGAIKFASKDLKEPFLVVNGDILTDLNLIEFIKNFKASSFENFIAVYECLDPRDFGLVRLANSGAIMEFLEKPTPEIFRQKRQRHINAGIYIFSPKVFKEINLQSFSVEREVFPRLSREGRLAAFPHRGFWQDVGTEERLENVRKILENQSL